MDLRLICRIHGHVTIKMNIVYFGRLVRLSGTDHISCAGRTVEGGCSVTLDEILSHQLRKVFRRMRQCVYVRLKSDSELQLRE